MRGAGQPIDFKFDFDPTADAGILRTLNSEFGKNWEQAIFEKPKPAVGAH
jgi:hypothetical protein